MSRVINDFIPLVFFMTLSSLNPVVEQRSIGYLQNDDGYNVSLSRDAGEMESRKELHLRLWMEDLFERKSTSFEKDMNEEVEEVYKLNLTNLNEDTYSYEKVPIHIEKTNDGKLATQLDYLQSQGTNILETKLNGLENKDKDTIYLKQNTKILSNGNLTALSGTIKPEELLDNEAAFNEYTGDVPVVTEGIDTIIESSNVHKVINFPLLTKNVATIPSIQKKSEQAEKQKENGNGNGQEGQVNNTISWVNDNILNESTSTAQIEANTLRTTGAPLPTLTAVSSDVYLLQGNNIYKQSLQTADSTATTTPTDADADVDSYTDFHSNAVTTSNFDYGLSQTVADTTTPTTTTEAAILKNNCS